MECLIIIFQLKKTVAKIHISNSELGKYVEQFGVGASNKRLTNDILDLPVKLAKSFIDGYLSADGSIDKKWFEKNIKRKQRTYLWGCSFSCQSIS